MKPFWIFIFGFISISNVYGQTYSALILDEQNATMKDVLIHDTINDVIALSDADGKFTIELKENSLFEISLIGYSSEFIATDQLKDTIQIFEDSRLLESVLVNSDIVKPVLDRPRMNIVDYHVYPDYVLALYSEKSQKFLSLNNSLGVQQVVSLGRVHGKSLVEDCFGNIHLLTKNMAYRLAIGQEISFASEVSIAEFNQLIKPCEAVIGSNIIISDVSNHNQKYTLALKVKPETQFNPFFTIYDRESASSASELYQEIVGMYMAEVAPIDNIITNEIWDGVTMRELAINHEIMPFVGFYEGVAAKPLNVQSFHVNENLLVFDLCFDSLYTFTKFGDRISAIHLPELKDKISKSVYRDGQSNTFYLVDFQKGYYQFSPINLKDGSLEEPYTFEELSFPKNIQIFNNYVYFTAPDNGFHKLYRFRLN